MFLKIAWQKAIRNFGILTACTICVLFFPDTYLFAAEREGSGFGRNLVIRQEVYECNGVWVYRAVALDEKIQDIIIDNNIESLEDYLRWLQENIKYKKDKGGDYWSTPEETLQRSYGDCEDYAFLNAAVLKFLGYRPRVLAMGVFGSTHAICVYEENGYYLWIDNTELKKTQTQSILEFAKYLFTEDQCSFLLTLSLETKDWDILFKKSEIINRKT